MIGQITLINNKPYLVYKSGAVKPLDSSLTKGNPLKGVNRRGYLYINISTAGRIQQKSIHRIVAETFIHNPERKSQVNHKNGIKTDNRCENLEWATPSENTKHAFDNNLIKKKFGKDNPQTKLSDFDKAYIRRLLIFGARQKDVAALYNVSRSLICTIK